MKTCVFINLADAVARRVAFEADFAAVQEPGWSLTRFEALGPAAVGALAGNLTPAEKGCFASHRAAVAAHADDPDTLDRRRGAPPNMMLKWRAQPSLSADGNMAAIVITNAEARRQRVHGALDGLPSRSP